MICGRRGSNERCFLLVISLELWGSLCLAITDWVEPDFECWIFCSSSSKALLNHTGLASSFSLNNRKFSYWKLPCTQNKVFLFNLRCRGSNNTVRIVMTISLKGAKRLVLGRFNSLRNGYRYEFAMQMLWYNYLFTITSPSGGTSLSKITSLTK